RSAPISISRTKPATTIRQPWKTRGLITRRARPSRRRARIEVAGDQAALLRRKPRLLAAAPIHHARAAGMEAAARRRGERAGNLAAQHDLAPARAGIERQRRREEGLRVRVLRAQRHIAGGAELDDLP